MDAQEVAKSDKRQYSIGRSLCIKAVMLVVGLLLVLWIGWPIPQQTERSPSIVSPSQFRVLPPSQVTHFNGNTVSPKQILTVQEDVEKAPRLRSKGLVIPPHSRLDVNRGTSDELGTLPGIGPVLARRIVQHREINGPFQSLEELTSVKGIGEIRLARLRPFIVIKKL